MGDDDNDSIDDDDNKKIYHLLSASSMPGSVLNSGLRSSHWTLTKPQEVGNNLSTS